MLQRAYVVLILLFMAAGCSRETITPAADPPTLTEAQQIERDRIDHMILQTIRESGQPFDWNAANADLFWDALQISDDWVVVGYPNDTDAPLHKSALQTLIAASEPPREDGQAILSHENDRFGYFYARIRHRSTIDQLRASAHLDFLEVKNYPFDLQRFVPEDSGPKQRETLTTRMSDMVLDPQSEVPYPDQVAAFNGGLRTVMHRHNMETAYLEAGVFGEDIGIAVIDNGILPEMETIFENNGYGERYKQGFYNFFWFFPWTNPDGYQPIPTDVLGISYLFYNTYFVHGSQMVRNVLTFSPNANIHSVRGSTWTVIITPDQVNGISDAITAMADDPEVRMISMSMGTIFQFNEMRLAIEYFHSKGKLIVVSAGSTLDGINDLIGVLYPGILPETTVATALKNRETTDGEFIVGDGSHGGPENDFAVENTSSSSEACSRAAGMISLIWSANPSLSREELMQVLIEASYFYRETGQKDPFFGWGPIDVGLAVELAQAG